MLKDKCKILNADASIMCTPLALLYEGLRNERGNEFGCLKPIPSIYSQAVLFDVATQRERQWGREGEVFRNLSYHRETVASLPVSLLPTLIDLKGGPRSKS